MELENGTFLVVNVYFCYLKRFFLPEKQKLGRKKIDSYFFQFQLTFSVGIWPKLLGS